MFDKIKIGDNMKKGFTLVELIAVILLIALIALVAFPPVITMIMNAENELDDANKEIILTQTKSFVDTNINDFPKINGNVYCVTMNEMASEGFLKSEFIDSLSEENQNLSVKVDVIDYEYNYDVVATCDEVIEDFGPSYTEQEQTLINVTELLIGGVTYPIVDGAVYCITVFEIYSDGGISSNFYNSLEDDLKNKTMEIKIINDSYEISIVDVCTPA